jgi:hypothetical protein
VPRQPLTVREGRPRPVGGYEGIPEHLQAQLTAWLDDVFNFRPHTQGTRDDVMFCVATALRIRLAPGYRGLSLYYDLMKWCEGDDEKYLDLIHAAIQTTETPWVVLDTMLTLSGSAWTATERGLQRRVAAETHRAFLVATRPEDTASEELTEAWATAYGRQPNPSDAWDHSIKAVEAILIDRVLPKQHNATLLHVIKHLETQGDLWRFGIPGAKGEYSVGPLIKLLRLLWPNPDRHADPKDRRTPALDEGRAIVPLAVTIVQWARDGQIARK